MFADGAWVCARACVLDAHAGEQNACACARVRVPLTRMVASI